MDHKKKRIIRWRLLLVGLTILLILGGFLTIRSAGIYMFNKVNATITTPAQQ